MIGTGEEDAAAVDLAEIVNELHKVRRSLKHEGVDRNAVPRAANDLFHGRLPRFRSRRPVPDRLAVLDVTGGLAVGDDDDLAITALLASEHLACDLEAVLHV